MLVKDYIIRLLVVLFVFIGSGCSNLEIIPDDDVWQPTMLTPEMVRDLSGGSLRTLHNAIQSERSVAMAMGVMADHFTCRWPNFGMRELSFEPRVTDFNNSPDYEYKFITEDLWRDAYRANADANLTLRYLYGGEKLGSVEEERLVEAFAWLVNGVAHGYIGLVFDKGAIVKWDSDVTHISLRPWQEVVDSSLAMLDNAIRIADANSFVVPPEWVGGQAMTNTGLSRLANSWAARILASSPRNMLQSESIDWGRVLNYAKSGLGNDFEPTLGEEYGWYDGYIVYSTAPGWCLVDLRILNIMNHDFPSRWPADNISWSTPDGKYPEFPTPGDLRLSVDFQNLPTSNPPFPLGYFNSMVRYKRYDYVFNTVWNGDKPKPTFLVWEVRLLEAEALVRTGDPSGALAILNDPASPRKARGGLPDVAIADDILRAILDEKDVECYLTGAGIPFFDMRRTDRLQAGTLLHFPVPAAELKLMGLPSYTIHAYTDGIEGSAGGWTGWD